MFILILKDNSNCFNQHVVDNYDNNKVRVFTILGKCNLRIFDLGMQTW